MMVSNVNSFAITIFYGNNLTKKFIKLIIMSNERQPEGSGGTGGTQKLGTNMVKIGTEAARAVSTKFTDGRSEHCSE